MTSAVAGLLESWDCCKKLDQQLQVRSVKFFRYQASLCRAPCRQLLCSSFWRLSANLNLSCMRCSHQLQLADGYSGESKALLVCAAPSYTG